jgi:hypothetical protein
MSIKIKLKVAPWSTTGYRTGGALVFYRLSQDGPRVLGSDLGVLLRNAGIRVEPGDVVVLDVCVRPGAPPKK